MSDPDKNPKKPSVIDWSGPWFALFELLNLLARDAFGAVSIVALAHVVEIVISYVSGPSWKWSAGNVEISPSDLVRYGDLVVLAGFIGIGLYEFLKWMKRQ